MPAATPSPRLRHQQPRRMPLGGLVVLALAGPLSSGVHAFVVLPSPLLHPVVSSSSSSSSPPATPSSTGEGPQARAAAVAVGAKGFGFGRRKKGDAAGEEDGAPSKYWQGIYAPFGEKRWPKQGEPCACGSGLAYEQCCHPLHAGAQPAATPEALLRSRYTAYYHGFPEYLLRSTHPSSAPRRKKSREKAYLELLEIACSEENLKQLQVGAQEAGEDENEAFITFRVKRHVWMSERSRFLKEGDGWLFFDEQV